MSGQFGRRQGESTATPTRQISKAALRDGAIYVVIGYILGQLLWGVLPADEAKFVRYVAAPRAGGSGEIAEFRGVATPLAPSPK